MIFEIESLEILDSASVNFDVEFLGASGSSPIDVDFGILSAQGYGDKTYVHSQNVAAKEWHVEHGLDKYPSVSVVDSGDNIVVGDVVYADKNSLTIYFSAPFSGRAYLN